MYAQQNAQMNMAWQQPMAAMAPMAYPMPNPAQFNQPNPSWAGNTARNLGIALIVFGLVAIICNGIILDSMTYGFLGYIGVGFWGGIFLLVTGILAIIAGVKRTNGLIIATLVLSILATLADVAVFGLSVTQVIYSGSYGNGYYGYNATLPVGLVFLVVSCTCFALLLTVSILTCRGISCQSSPGYYPAMMYMPGGQPVAMIPGGYMGGQQASPPPAYANEKHQ